MQRNVLFMVFMTVMIDLLGFGILIPVIPKLFTDVSSVHYMFSPEAGTATGYILLGIIVSIFPLMQFFATPVLGQMSDRWGRRPVLILSLIGTAIGYVLFAYGINAKIIWLLFFARIIDGITGGNISVAQAAVADVSAPKDRAANFGLIGAAFGIGFIIGPFIGGKLSDPNFVSWFTPATPFWTAAILSTINVLSAYFFFPETIHHKITDTKYHLYQSIDHIKKAFSIKKLRVLFATSFLFWGGFAFFTTFIGVYLTDHFGFHETQIGTFFAFVGIWIGISQALITRYMAAHAEESTILKYSLIATSAFILFFFIPNGSFGLYILVPFFAIANGLTQANMPGLISRLASDDEQGEILGISASVQALSQIAPPIVSGFIAARFDSGAPIAASAFVIFFAWIAFVMFYREELDGEDETGDLGNQGKNALVRAL